MAHKDMRRHPKHWPNALKNYVMMLELRQPKPTASERKPNLDSVPMNIGGVDARLPAHVKLSDSEKVSRAAQSHGLKVIKVLPQFGRPHFEFRCAKSGALVFGFFPRTSDCTFDVACDAGRTTKSLRARNIFDALRIVSFRDEIVVRGKIEQRWKSPTRRAD